VNPHAAKEKSFERRKKRAERRKGEAVRGEGQVSAKKGGALRL